MRASTYTLELDPAVDWRSVGLLKERRPVTAIAARSGARRDRCGAMVEPMVSQSWRTAVGSRIGDALEFALFAVTLAAIGWLHYQIVVLLW